MSRTPTAIHHAPAPDDAEPVTFMCANLRCRRYLTAPANRRGHRSKCPDCGAISSVPKRLPMPEKYRETK